MVLGLLFAPLVLKAQHSPVYQLNQQVIDLRNGVDLSAYSQLEAVALSFTEASSVTAYDSLVIYLARGNKSLVKQVVALENNQRMDIRALLERAQSGDRLVLEIFPKKDEESLITVVALN